MEHVSFDMLHGTREFRCVTWNTWVSVCCMEHVSFDGHVHSGLGLILQAEIKRLN